MNIINYQDKKLAYLSLSGLTNAIVSKLSICYVSYGIDTKEIVRHTSEEGDIDS